MPNSGAGDCFFKAISQIVYGKENRHEGVRSVIADEVETLPGDVMQGTLALLGIPDREAYVKRLRKLGTWAGELELVATGVGSFVGVFLLSVDVGSAMRGSE